MLVTLRGYRVKCFAREKKDQNSGLQLNLPIQMEHDSFEDSNVMWWYIL